MEKQSDTMVQLQIQRKLPKIEKTGASSSSNEERETLSDEENMIDGYDRSATSARHQATHNALAALRR